jgi:hypothetical protein
MMVLSMAQQNPRCCSRPPAAALVDHLIVPVEREPLEGIVDIVVEQKTISSDGA